MITAIVLVGTEVARIPEVAEAIADLPGVTEVYSVTGDADLIAIVRVRAPEVPEGLARQVAAAVEAFRGLELYKPPGVAETIDWAQALAALGRATLDERSVAVTLGTILKYREDQERVRSHGISELVGAAVARSA